MLGASPWIKYGALVGLGAFGLIAAIAPSRWLAPTVAAPVSTAATAPALVEVSGRARSSSPRAPARRELEAAAAPSAQAPAMPMLAAPGLMPLPSSRALSASLARPSGTLQRARPPRTPRMPLSHAAATPRSLAVTDEQKSLRAELLALEASQSALRQVESMRQKKR